MLMLAIVWPAVKLSVDVPSGEPQGYAAMKPSPVGSVTVRFKATAVAPAGTPARPETWTGSSVFAASGAPPRVSSRRTGVSSPNRPLVLLEMVVVRGFVLVAVVRPAPLCSNVPPVSPAGVESGSGVPRSTLSSPGAAATENEGRTAATVTSAAPMMRRRVLTMSPLGSGRYCIGYGPWADRRIS